MKRQDLLTALEIVKPGLASKELIEQSTSFAFMQGRIVTYNDTISITHPVEDLDVQGAVKADALYKFLNKATAEELQIKQTENEIQIKAGKTVKAGLRLHQKIVLPLDQLGEISEWKDLPSSFIPALKLGMHSCSKDMSRPALTCVHARKGVVESTDGMRATQVQCKIKDDFLIPATTVQDLVKYPVIQMASGEGWLHFKTEQGTVFSARIYDAEFPSEAIDAFMKVEGIEIELPTKIEEMMERTGIFAKREHVLDEEITVNLKNNMMVVRGEGDTGWEEEKAKVKYKGEEISFTVNPEILKQIAKHIKKCTISESAMKFEAETWQHAVVL